MQQGVELEGVELEGVELEGVDKKRRRALRLRRVKKGPQNGGRNE